MDDILQHKEKIDYYELINSLGHGHRLFIEGRPGCGKTTFVHKISQDWAKTPYHGSMRLVLLVSLRVLNNLCKPKLEISDILGIFENLKLTKEELLAREGKGVCFIFDGYDEFSPSDGNHSIVHKIINKECLQQSIVIVASRPVATAVIRHKATKVVEVLGFKRDQIFEYFDAYPFSCSPVDHQFSDVCLKCRELKSQKLRSYLLQHPNILHICYLPIHCFMVSFLFECTGKVPHTETEIYKHFTKFLIKRNLSKNSKFDLNAEIDVHNMDGEEGKLFNQICKLALEKTILNKQVLHQDEVSSYFKSVEDRDISLGLITVDCLADQLYHFKKIYTFLHLSFQEYLAAYHVSTLTYEKQISLIKGHGSKHHMQVVWKFYCGLVEMKDKFKSILSETEQKTLFHIQCAYESQQKIVCAQLLKSISYHIKLADQYLSTPDFTAMGYVTNTSILPTRLSIVNCNINIEAIDAFLSEMEDRSKHSLHALCYKSRRINNAELQCLVKLLSNLGSLKVLRIKSSTKTLISVPKHVTLYSFTDIMELVVINIDIHPLCLLENLKHFTKLVEISLINCSIQKLVDIQDLSKSLKNCKRSLKKLNISDNSINSEGALILAITMQQYRNLEVVNISNNEIPIFAATEILNSLKHCNLKVASSEIVQQKKDIKISNGELFCMLDECSNLQSLDTNLVSSPESIDIQYFAVYSKRWQKLKELRIEQQQGEPPEKLSTTTVLCHCLEHFKFLEVLALTYGLLYSEVAQNLVEGLKHCPNLIILDLSFNEIGPIEVQMITAGLTNCPNLKELNLNDNCIGNEGSKILPSYIKHCHSLRVLKLCNNDIDHENCEALTSNLKISNHLLHTIDFEATEPSS